MPESAITIGELGDVGLPREVSRGRSPESWLVDYGIQPDAESDPPLLPEEKIGKELIDSAPKLIGGLSPLLPPAPFTAPPQAPARSDDPSPTTTAPAGGPITSGNPVAGGAPVTLPQGAGPLPGRPDVTGEATVAPAAGGNRGGDATPPAGGSAPGVNSGGNDNNDKNTVPGNSNARVNPPPFVPVDVTAPDAGSREVLAIVPEPVSLLLFGTSAAGWVIFTRLRGRRRTHQG